MRVKNWLYYIRNFIINNFSNQKVPYSAQIELTLRCNASCSFCSFPSIFQSSPSSINREMSTEQIKHIIDQIAKLGVNALSFTGGEPTLRKDLPEIIYHAGINRKLLTGIATNGYLMPQLFKDNGKLDGFNYILLSVDYPSADLHDRMRGIKVFDKAMKTIALANKKDIKVIISTVIMKDNLKYMEEMCELADRLNCSIELYPCEDIIRDFSNQSYFIENIANLIPNISLWANIMRFLRTKYKNILTDPLSILIVEKGGFGGFPDYHQNILRCHVAEAYLFVRYDGFIDYPCKIHPIKSFNALTHPISMIYNSKEVRDIMEKFDSYPFCSGCRIGCAITSSMPTRWKTLGSKYVLGYLRGNLK